MCEPCVTDDQKLGLLSNCSTAYFTDSPSFNLQASEFSDSQGDTPRCSSSPTQDSDDYLLQVDDMPVDDDASETSEDMLQSQLQHHQRNFSILSLESNMMSDVVQLLNSLDAGFDESNNTPMAISLANSDYPLVWVTDTFAQLSGYTREECIGKNCFFQLDNLPMDEEVCKGLVQAILTGARFTAVLNSRRKDGSFCRILFDLLTLKVGIDHNGKPVNFLVVTQKEVPERLADANIKSEMTKEQRLVKTVHKHVTQTVHKVATNSSLFAGKPWEVALSECISWIDQEANMNMLFTQPPSPDLMLHTDLEVLQQKSLRWADSA
jgi:PAS domain-containing protein